MNTYLGVLLLKEHILFLIVWNFLCRYLYVYCACYMHVYSCLHVVVRGRHLVVITLHVISLKKYLLLSVKFQEKVTRPAVLQSMSFTGLGL